MDWFEKIKYYYDNELWDIERVKDVVGKVIAKEEYKLITGEDYTE